MSADNQQERHKNLHPWYITGFVEGEGSFHIALHHDARMKQQVKIIPEFRINQPFSRIEIIQDIQKYFECGNIRENHVQRKTDHTYVYVVRNRKDLIQKIIPFFRKYPMRSKKQYSFNLFAKVVEEMMFQGRHKMKSEILQIIDYAYRMNENGKYRRKAQACLLDSLESSETIRRNLFKKR